MKKSKQPVAKQGQVRIIAGQCRGRKIYFPDLKDLRPTPNRIRETLFNWLAPYIHEAACLDLFAGSGALSFEAMSRGARYCLLFEVSQIAIKALQENCFRLGFNHIDIVESQFPYAMSKLKEDFNIVFIDPPFEEGFLQPVIDWLVASKSLKPDALIYIESHPSEPYVIPEEWQVMKDKQAGQVHYALIRACKYA